MYRDMQCSYRDIHMYRNTDMYRGRDIHMYGDIHMNRDRDVHVYRHMQYPDHIETYIP